MSYLNNPIHTKCQDMTIYEIAKTYTPVSWEKVFKFADPELEELSEILEEEENKILQPWHAMRENNPDCNVAKPLPFYPLKRDLFKAFELTRLPDVKVIILGQDPYPNTDHHGNPCAQGMSFSVAPDVAPPASLRNIFKEIGNEYPDPADFQYPQHGDLTAWARQGVFLLNTCLTVRPGAPDSHKKIWLGFVIKVIQAINKKHPKAIYVLWDKKAQDLTKFIGGKVHILKSSHPSPWACKNGGDFFGNGHFKKINEILAEEGKTPIDWNLPQIINYDE